MDESHEKSTGKSKAEPKTTKKGREVASRYMNPVVKTPKTPIKPVTPTKANASGSNSSKAERVGMTTPTRPPRSRPRSAERPAHTRAQREDVNDEDAALVAAINARTARIISVEMEAAREKVKVDALQQLRGKAMDLIKLMNSATDRRLDIFQQKVKVASQNIISSCGDVEAVSILIQAATVKLRVLSHALQYKADFVPFSGNLSLPISADDEGQSALAKELIQTCGRFQSLFNRLVELTVPGPLSELSNTMSKFCALVKSVDEGIEVNSRLVQRFMELFVEFVYSLEFIAVSFIPYCNDSDIHLRSYKN